MTEALTVVAAGRGVMEMCLHWDSGSQVDDVTEVIELNICAFHCMLTWQVVKNSKHKRHIEKKKKPKASTVLGQSSASLVLPQHFSLQ